MKQKAILSVLIIFLVVLPIGVFANNKIDSDHDSVPDDDEINIYHTDPNNPDSDGDGYNDGEELRNGYSPLNPGKVKLEDVDTDKDGLSDRLELSFHTDLTNPDSDSDGYKDGEEIQSGFDPLDKDRNKLPKRIEINTGRQELSYFLGGVRMGIFKVSSGKPAMPTPKGHFKIDGKSLKAWSKYGLWMPYWMSLSNGYFGIHELPVWPNGYREGADHLGKPVSHGCVRLGIGPAKFLYDWAEIGTPVFIY